MATCPISRVHLTEYWCTGHAHHKHTTAMSSGISPTAITMTLERTALRDPNRPLGLCRPCRGRSCPTKGWLQIHRPRAPEVFVPIVYHEGFAGRSTYKRRWVAQATPNQIPRSSAPTGWKFNCRGCAPQRTTPVKAGSILPKTPCHCSTITSA